MLEISGDKVMRDGQTVGYVIGTYIKDHAYKDLGYYEGNHVHDKGGKKVAYIEGEYLYPQESRSSYTELDKVNKAIEGGALPEIAKCAVYLLIGA